MNDWQNDDLDSEAQEIRASLRQIERRDWWFWGHSVVVITLLAAAVLSFSLPSLLRNNGEFFQFNLSQAVRGLVALVLLFNVYTLYQQVQIKRLRRELSERQIDAEVFRRLALSDPLTGLYNRRFAKQRLAVEVARSTRKGYPLTVLMLDLNGFKQINDRYGHPTGDLVLKEFAEHLNRSIRGSDFAMRVGGDEFLVLLPECPLGQLQTVLARLSPLEVSVDSQKIPVSFSCGWKEYTPGEPTDDLLESADRALYANKRASNLM